jgi:SAM-dependent methyltransferase
MTSALESFLDSLAAPRRDGVFFLSEPSLFEEKERRYGEVRAREGRVYSDDVVRRLPRVAPGHPLAAEWAARADSLSRLLRYVSRRSHAQTTKHPERNGGRTLSGAERSRRAHAAPLKGVRLRELSILDLGCGNGWLANHLALLAGVRVCGLDLNQRELTQAARVFVGADVGAVVGADYIRDDDTRLKFLYADIFTVDLPVHIFDLVVLASVVQYFPDLPALLRRLLPLLAPGGELHILDSPLYDPLEIRAAQERTRAYYAALGFPEMAADYHHHALSVLAPFRPTILYNPRALWNRAARKFGAARSPFPWIRIGADR